MIEKISNKINNSIMKSKILLIILIFLGLYSINIALSEHIKYSFDKWLGIIFGSIIILFGIIGLVTNGQRTIQQAK